MRAEQLWAIQGGKSGFGIFQILKSEQDFSGFSVFSELFLGFEIWKNPLFLSSRLWHSVNDSEFAIYKKEKANFFGFQIPKISKNLVRILKSVKSQIRFFPLGAIRKPSGTRLFITDIYPFHKSRCMIIIQLNLHSALPFPPFLLFL